MISGSRFLSYAGRLTGGLLAVFLLGNCATYQAEENRREMRLIENDIVLLKHAGRMLETVYRGGRKRKLMLPGSLDFIQGYFRKAPALYSQIPEARQYHQDRQLLMNARDAAGSIAIYRKLRVDIDRTVRALRKRRDHMARGQRPGKKFLAPAGVAG